MPAAGAPCRHHDSLPPRRRGMADADQRGAEGVVGEAVASDGGCTAAPPLKTPFMDSNLFCRRQRAASGIAPASDAETEKTYGHAVSVVIYIGRYLAETLRREICKESPYRWRFRKTLC